MFLQTLVLGGLGGECCLWCPCREMHGEGKDKNEVFLGHAGG